MTRSDAVKTVAQAATLLFSNGQTTERIVVAAERLGRALGTPVTLHPRWGELEVRVDGTPHSAIVPATPLGVDMAKVHAAMRSCIEVRIPGHYARMRAGGEIRSGSVTSATQQRMRVTLPP